MIFQKEKPPISQCLEAFVPRTGLQMFLLPHWIHPSMEGVKIPVVVYTNCEVIITDNKGIMVPEASNMVTFEIEGPAELLGVENGDILDLSHHKVPYRNDFKGKISI